LSISVKCSIPLESCLKTQKLSKSIIEYQLFSDRIDLFCLIKKMLFSNSECMLFTILLFLKFSTTVLKGVDDLQFNALTELQE